jgi:integrase
MSIRKLPDGRWEWRHRVDGKHLKKRFDRRADAVAHDSKIRADLARGVHVDTSNRTTVAEYFQQWIDGRVYRPQSLRNRTVMLRRHVEPLPLGSRPIVKVKPSEIQAWARDRASVLGPRALHNTTGVLRTVFATAVLDGVIARNPVLPAGRLSLPKIDNPKLAPLTVGQVAAWADAAEPRVRAMILAQAGLGLRISELLALRVADVDFLRRVVHVTGQLDSTGRRAPPKTANSRRDVPLPSVTGETIAEHIRQFPPGPGGLIFTPAPRKPFRSNGSRNAGGAVLTGEPGTWRLSKQCVAYRAAAAVAGIPGAYSSHDLRHHYASVLLDAGESVHAVADRLGNTAEKVLSVYGHLMPDKEDQTRRAVDAAWDHVEQGARSAR